MKPALALMVCLILLPGAARAQEKTYSTSFSICDDVNMANCHKVETIDDITNPDAPKLKIVRRGDTSWHLLTVSMEGTVSLIKGLSKKECEHIRNSLILYSGPNQAFEPDMRKAECFQ